MRPNTGSPTARSAWAKASTVVVGRHIAGVEVHLRRPARSRGAGSPRGSRPDSAARRRPSRPTMPKSTAVSRAGGGDEQVPLVQVGVEDAVVQGLGQEGADQVVGQRRPVEARLRQRGGIGERRAVRPLQGQHPLADAVPDHRRARACSRRGPSPRAARRRRRPRSAGRAPAPAPAPPSRRRRRGSSRRAGGDQALGQPRGQCAAPRRRPRRAARSPAAAPSPPPARPSISVAGCAWASEAAAIGSSKLAEQALERPAERRGDLGLGLLGRERRQPVLQPRQVVGEGERRRCRRGSRGTGRA